jgi:hypothetical protein
MSTIDQQNAFSAFLHPTVPLLPRGKVLPHWYLVFFRGVPLLGALYVIGIGSIIANLALDTEFAAKNWYRASLGFMLAHGLFSWPAWTGIQGTCGAEAGPEKNEKAMRKWLGLNGARVLVSDFPAWVAIVGGVVMLLLEGYR